MQLQSGKEVKLQIWDTAGQDRFRSITKNYYKGSHGIILIYDVTSLKTFENVKSWVSQIHEEISDKVVIYLVGNKIDMDDERKVQTEVAKEVRIEPVVNDDVKYIDFLPVYSIKAACGYFGEGDDVSELGWIQVDGVGKLNRNMFVVQASGHSMEPRINDGDFCVFRANPGGSRQGKIVLVQHHNFYDSDYSGAYSIKEYSSSKSYDEFGNWQHEKIELIPLNKDYNPIIINAEESEDFRVIGEFVGMIK